MIELKSSQMTIVVSDKKSA